MSRWSAPLPHRLAIAAGCLFALAFAGAALAAAPVTLVRGDLLVTDFNNKQVLRVNHRNGSTAVFSPREGQTNRITVPSAIAIDPSGFVYVVNEDTSQLVVIDPYTGNQLLAQVCPPQQFCSDLNLGTTPTGIAISSSSPGFSSLYEIAWSGLYGLSRSSVTQWSSTLVSGLSVSGQITPMISPSAIAYSALDTKVYVPDGSALNEEDVSNPGVFTRDVNTGGPQISHVVYEPTLQQVFFTQWVISGQGCDQTQSGLRHYAGGQVFDDSLGGLLHCPGAVAEGDPVQTGFPFYVLDQGSETTSPASPQLVVVVADGLPGAPQSQLVDFTKIGIPGVNPGAIAVSPVDFVPEPGAGALGAAALGLLALLRRRYGISSTARKRARPLFMRS